MDIELAQALEEIAELRKQNTNLQIMLQAEREVRCNKEYLKKVTELEAQIEKMKCCVVSCCEGCERLPKLYKEFENGNKEM